MYLWPALGDAPRSSFPAPWPESIYLIVQADLHSEHTHGTYRHLGSGVTTVATPLCWLRSSHLLGCTICLPALAARLHGIWPVIQTCRCELVWLLNVGALAGTAAPGEKYCCSVGEIMGPVLRAHYPEPVWVLRCQFRLRTVAFPLCPLSKHPLVDYKLLKQIEGCLMYLMEKLEEIWHILFFTSSHNHIWDIGCFLSIFALNNKYFRYRSKYCLHQIKFRQFFFKVLT